MNTSKGFGLNPLAEDNRDFPLGKAFNLPPIEDLPSEFKFKTLGVKDQRQTDFCVAFAGAVVSELQERVGLSPEYLFAKAKELEGDYTTWGLNLRQIGEALTKKGSIEQADVPFTVEDKDREFLANWENWPKELDKKALLHMKKSYFWIYSFDEIKQAIWKFREKGEAPIIGMMWDYPNDQKKLVEPKSTGYGHSIAVIGWANDSLIIQNSWGKSAGDEGEYYLSRKIIDEFIPKYGALFFVDLDPKTAKKYLEEGVKVDSNWVIKLFKSLIAFVKDLWK